MNKRKRSKVQGQAIDIIKLMRIAHEKAVDDFGLRRALWIDTVYGVFYLRHQFWDGSHWQRAYVLANISVHNEYRGKGLFTKIVEGLHSLKEIVVIENVLDGRFQHKLHRLGFTVVEKGDNPHLSVYLPSMVLLPEADWPCMSELFQVGENWYYWTPSHETRGPFIDESTAIHNLSITNKE